MLATQTWINLDEDVGEHPASEIQHPGVLTNVWSEPFDALHDPPFVRTDVLYFGRCQVGQQAASNASTAFTMTPDPAGPVGVCIGGII